MLKSQGHRILSPWETRSLLGACKQNRALSMANHLAENPVQTRVGKTSHGASGPGCVWYSFCPPRSTKAKAQHACVLRPPEHGGAGC